MLDTRLAGARFPARLLPFNQLTSMADTFARLGSGAGAQPFATVADYEAFLRRCDDFADWADSAIASLREGLQRGITVPRPVVARIVPQLEALAAT